MIERLRLGRIVLSKEMTMRAGSWRQRLLRHQNRARQHTRATTRKACGSAGMSAAEA